jgi:replicative DNA helicase
VTTPARIRSELVAAQAVGRPFTYVVIDTVNLVEVPGAESYRLGLNALLRDLKSLAVRNRCVIHLQAQLKRDDLGGGNNAPKLTDLRESSAMEQTGDVVLLLHRPVAGDGNFEAVGELHLAKARSTRRRGAIQVAFDEFRFREGGLYRAGAPRPDWGVVA